MANCFTWAVVILTTRCGSDGLSSSNKIAFIALRLAWAKRRSIAGIAALGSMILMVAEAKTSPLKMAIFRSRSS